MEIKGYIIGFLIVVVLLPIVAFTSSIELTLSIIGVLVTGALINTSYNADILEKIKKDIKEIKKQTENIQKEVDIIVGANLFMRKSVLDEVGIFDEDFFLYDEETELQYRIKKAGYKIIINPESKIYHLELAKFRL